MSVEELVDKTILNNRENIDLLNTFSRDFFQTNNTINEKVVSMFANVEKMIEEEKKKENILDILESKINSSELGNTLKQLVEKRVVLNDKYNDLNNLILNNNKKIENISNTIKENKQIIDSVYKIIGVLDENINNINTVVSSRQ